MACNTAHYFQSDMLVLCLPLDADLVRKSTLTVLIVYLTVYYNEWCKLPPSDQTCLTPCLEIANTLRLVISLRSSFVFVFFMTGMFHSSPQTMASWRQIGWRAGPLIIWSQKVICNADCDLQSVWAIAQSCWKNPYSFSSCKFTKKVRKSVDCSLHEVTSQKTIDHILIVFLTAWNTPT